MTAERSACKSHMLLRLFCLATLVECISLTSCDQSAPIARVEPADDTEQADPTAGNDDTSGDTYIGDASDGVDIGDASDGADASDDADIGDASDGGGCDRPFVTGCDPTKESVCAAPTKCVVDYLASSPGGFCVMPSESLVVCYNQYGITDTCPPTLFCWYGMCREPCLCDEDCATGRCCDEPVNDTGFKLCADC